MVIYLIGPDSYRRERKLKRLLGEYRDKNAQADFFEVEFENGGEWESFRKFVEQPSLFLAKKFVVLRGALGWMDRAGAEAIHIAAHDTRIFVIVVDVKPPKKMFLRLLDRPALTQEFPLLEGDKLAAFLTREGRERGMILEPDALRFFMDYAMGVKEDRGWLCASALDTMGLAGFSQPVGIAAVREILGRDKARDIFSATIEFFRNEQSLRRLACLQSMLFDGYAPSHIFNMLGTMARARGDVLRFAECDERIKSGALDDETALLEFVLGG